MRRVLIVLVVGCAALFAARWLRSPESAATSIESPAKPFEVARVESELAATEPVAERDVAPGAVSIVTQVDPVVPIVASASPTVGSGLRLWGTIRSDSAPLEPIQVECQDGLHFQRGTHVDERSQYSFDGLPPGIYWLQAGHGATGITRARVDLQADTCVDLAFEVLRVIDVRVVDEHGVEWAPPGVAIIVTNSEPSGLLDLESTPPRPLLNRPVVPGAGRAPPTFAALYLTSRVPQYASLIQNETVVQTRSVGQADKKVVFEIAREELTPNHGTVAFRLVGAADRSPLPDSTVSMCGPSVVLVECPGGVGRAKLPPGPWVLRFVSPGLAGIERAFRIEPTTDLDLGEISVGGYVVRGQVVDERGSGRSAFVIHVPSDAHAVGMVESMSFWGTSADGSFELRGLPPGHHGLAVSSMLGQPTSANRGSTITPNLQVDLDPEICHRVVEVRDEDVNGIVLTLRPGIALVVRPSGREKTGAGFRVRSTDGVVMDSCGLTPHEPVRVLLSPGSYDVETWTERDGPRQRTPIEVVRDMVVVDVR